MDLKGKIDGSKAKLFLLGIVLGMVIWGAATNLVVSRTLSNAEKNITTIYSISQSSLNIYEYYTLAQEIQSAPECEQNILHRFLNEKKDSLSHNISTLETYQDNHALGQELRYIEEIMVEGVELGITDELIDKLQNSVKTRLPHIENEAEKSLRLSYLKFIR